MKTQPAGSLIEQRKFYAGLLLSALLILGCSVVSNTILGRNTLRGSGQLVTEQRAVRDFDRISITAIGDVNLTQGESETLLIEADDNLLPYIETRVENGTLILGLTEEARDLNIRPSKPIRFNLTIINLASLSIPGSGDIYSAGLKLDNLTIDIAGSGHAQLDALEANFIRIDIGGSGVVNIDSLFANRIDVGISGSGEVRVYGEVNEQEISIPGSGDYQARKLISDLARVEISGSGAATVWAIDRLDVHIPGSGTVRYGGSPAVTQSISGSGAVIQLGE